MANIKPTDSILAGVDWQVLAYAAGMAAIMSLLTTLRARRLQHEAGVPLSSWMSLIPDTLLGGIIGAAFAVAIPEYIKPLKTFVGTFVLAGLGGILGPRVTDWISANGLDTLLDYLGSGAGRLSKAVAGRKGGGHDGGKTDGPQEPDEPA